MANELGLHAHATIRSPGPVFRGGCIRFGDGGPYLYINPAHNSVGIIPSSVGINDHGDLTFMLDESLPVISTYAVADETNVSQHISAGISGGVGLCNVWMVLDTQSIGSRLDLHNATHYGKVRGSTSNLWVGINSWG